MKNILSNLVEISLPGGFAAKIRRESELAANKAITQKDQAEGPTKIELEAAERIGFAALGYDLDVFRKQIRQYAVEYERIRSTMKSGVERTRSMQSIVAKLRTVAIAARPLLSELSESQSAGERLAAVVILQVQPETEWISWLSKIGAQDMTFVGHQATVALLMASRIFQDAESENQIMEAVTQIKNNLNKESRPHHREKILGQIERERKKQGATG